MTTYYVSPYGSDANNGLGPDASAGTNKPWLTLAKLLGASGFASGDTAYICPGTYREAVTVAMTSATGTTRVLGDPQNVQGFKDNNGALLTGGDVIWTAFTTNDWIAPSTSCLNLAGRDFLLFQFFTFYNGSVNCVNATTKTSTDCSFIDCMFIGYGGATGTGNIISWAAAANIALNLTINRCFFLYCSTVFVLLTIDTPATADFNLVVLIQNCSFIGAGGQSIQIASGVTTNTFKYGGMSVYNCTHVGTNSFVNTASAGHATSIPTVVYNCVSIGGNLQAQTSGQIVEDYNFLNSRASVAIGTHSRLIGANAIEGWQSYLSGRQPRPFMSAALASPLLGFASHSGGPTVDALNRPRPSGVFLTASGTATSGAATTVTDSNAAWGTNQWTGYTVSITSGTGSGQTAVVVSNTATVLTCPASAFSPSPDSTSTYSLYKATGVTTQDYAVGAFERHDQGQRDSVTYDVSPTSLRIIGVGDVELTIPVDATSTTISIRNRFDTAHGTGAPPDMVLLASGEIGVTTQTVAAAANANTWQTITLAAINPTAKGYVTLRLRAHSAVSNGLCWFDSLSVV